MIQSCFSQPGSPSSISQVPQNLVTCIYQTQLCNSPTRLTLTWSTTLFSRFLFISSSDIFSTTISLNPSAFSLFKTRPGSKSIHLAPAQRQRVRKIKLYWDFSRARYTHNCAEPDCCFYFAIVSDGKLEFFLGDLFNDLSGRSSRFAQPPEPVLLSRREHVLGSRSFKSRAQFLGCKHEIEIECDEGVLKVKVDGQSSLVVRRLSWKFRGNERILIDGTEVEFFWDVLSWVNNSDSNGHGVFVFQVGDGGVMPEMVGPERKLMKKGLSAGTTAAPAMVPLTASPSNSSVLQWTEESSDGGRSSCSSSRKSCGSNGGFSLMIYAWSRD